MWGDYMNLNNLYKKIEQLLSFINEELDKPSNRHSYETRIWEKGYKRGMLVVKKFIENMLYKDS